MTSDERRARVAQAALRYVEKTEGKMADDKIATRDTDEALARPTEVQQMHALISAAVDKGTDPEALERLFALHERVAERGARKAFIAAKAAFQAECPPITKATTANIRQGFSYSYAELDHIVRTIMPSLARHGLAFSWDSKTDGDTLIATCILSHADGHSESASFTCPTSAKTHAMSGPQQVAAANTFARRQSLVQVLGLTTTEPDHDGAEPMRGETITESQAADIDALIDEVGADRKRFLDHFRVDSVESVRAADFGRAIKMLEAKRQQR